MAALMTRILAVALLLCATCVGQSAAPIPDDQVSQRKEILKNNRVLVSRLTLPPGDQTAMHKHDMDMVTVFVNGGLTKNTLLGKEPASDKMTVGEVRFKNMGFTHSTRNVGPNPLIAVIVEFIDPQGKLKNIGKKSQTCAPGTKICVEEKELFCTDKVCVEDVVMAPGAVTLQHSHATDHMLIAVSDYQLTDEVQGKGTVVRQHKSGEVEYIPAGISHRLTNTGGAPALFTVILWR
jgi:quercetin dioxygenase-like cupin family protein